MRLGQNQTAYGLQFETLKAHQELLTQIGFLDVQTHQGTGLGSNLTFRPAETRGVKSVSAKA